MNATLSRRPLRRFWGWGAASEHLTQEESSRISMMVQMLGGQITVNVELFCTNLLIQRMFWRCQQDQRKQGNRVDHHRTVDVFQNQVG